MGKAAFCVRKESFLRGKGSFGRVEGVLFAWKRQAFGVWKESFRCVRGTLFCEREKQRALKPDRKNVASAENSIEKMAAMPKVPLKKWQRCRKLHRKSGNDAESSIEKVAAMPKVPSKKWQRCRKLHRKSGRDAENSIEKMAAVSKNPPKSDRIPKKSRPAGRLFDIFRKADHLSQSEADFPLRSRVVFPSRSEADLPSRSCERSNADLRYAGKPGRYSRISMPISVS